MQWQFVYLKKVDIIIYERKRSMKRKYESEKIRERKIKESEISKIIYF